MAKIFERDFSFKITAILVFKLSGTSSSSHSSEKSIFVSEKVKSEVRSDPFLVLYFFFNLRYIEGGLGVTRT